MENSATQTATAIVPFINYNQTLDSDVQTVIKTEKKIKSAQRRLFIGDTDHVWDKTTRRLVFGQNGQAFQIGKVWRQAEKLERKEKSLKTQIREQEDFRQEIVEHNEQVKIHNTKVDTLTEQKAQFLNRQEEVNSDILNLKSKVQNLTILRKAFSTTGIVAFKLENLAKELEETINHYLSEFSDGQFQLIFRLTGDKLNIVIFNHGKETTI